MGKKISKYPQPTIGIENDLEVLEKLKTHVRSIIFYICIPPLGCNTSFLIWAHSITLTMKKSDIDLTNITRIYHPFSKNFFAIRWTI